MVTLEKKQIDDTSNLYEEVVAANNEYARAYTAQPHPFAHKRAVLLTCMDARLLTHNIMGFEAGDMYVVRNAGGRASDDAIRSLVIACTLLKADQFFVVHHTDCGMQRFTDKSMNELLERKVEVDSTLNYCSATLKKSNKNSAYTCNKASRCCGETSCVNYQCIDWLTIQHGLFKSVLEDVKRIRNHPLISSDIPIYGFIFDVMTGKLIPVNKAMKAGKANYRAAHKK